MNTPVFKKLKSTFRADPTLENNTRALGEKMHNSIKVIQVFIRMHFTNFKIPILRETLRNNTMHMALFKILKAKGELPEH